MGGGEQLMKGVCGGGVGEAIDEGIIDGVSWGGK